MTPAEIARLEAPPNCDRFIRSGANGNLLFVTYRDNTTQAAHGVSVICGVYKIDCACVALQYWRMEMNAACSYPIGLMPSTARGEEVCSINQERAAKAMEQLELWQRFGGFGDFANLNFKRA